MMSVFIRRCVSTVAMVATLAAGAWAHVAPDCGLTDTQRSRVRLIVKEMVARGYAPGAVVDIRCDGRAWLAQAEGVADPSTQKVSQIDDIFRIYSMTKPLTSFLALKLAEDGLLSVDDPVGQYLPEFAKITIWAGTDALPPESHSPLRPLTIRDLLRHTAGFSYISNGSDAIHKTYAIRGIDDGSGRVFVPTDGSAPIASLPELVTRIAEVPLLHQPGARHSYGNSHDILGRLIEVIARKPFRDVLQERVLSPLGMNDTAFEVPSDKVSRFTAASAAPSSGSNKKFLRDTPLTDLSPAKTMLIEKSTQSIFRERRAVDFGGAGLVSTASDYQRFMSLLMNEGEVEGKRIVHRETLTPLYTNQLEGPVLKRTQYAQQGFGFGYGLTVVTDPQLAPAKLPAGAIVWGGAASTYFWVDRKHGVSGTLLTQVFGGDVAPHFVAILQVLYSSGAGHRY